MIFKNPLKTSFSLRNILITICVGCVYCNIFFFFKKQAFNGLLKFIHIFKMWENQDYKFNPKWHDLKGIISVHWTTCFGRSYNWLKIHNDIIKREEK